MSKSVSDNGPLILGPGNNPGQQGAASQAQGDKGTGPLILSGPQTSKKKDGGSPGPSPSPSDDDVKKAAQNWQDKKLSADDVKTLSQTDKGKTENLDKLTPQQQGHYADAHNNGTNSELIQQVRDLTTKYADLLYAVNPGGTVQGALNESITKATQKNRQDLIARVAAGDTDAISQFRKMTVANLESQVKELQQQHRTGDLATQNVLPVIRDPKIRQEVLDSANAKTKDLQDQIKQINSTMETYMDELLVNQMRKSPGGINSSDNMVQIGRERRRLNGITDSSFQRQQNITDTVAITEQNYEDKANGLAAIIESEKRGFADDYKGAVRSGDPNWQEPLQKRAQQINALINQRANLPSEYFPVQVSQVARLLGNRISQDNKVFNLWISKGDITQAVNEIEQESPGFRSKYKPAIDYIMQYTHTVPKQGLYGAIERGLNQGVEGLERSIGDMVGARNEEDRVAREIRDRWEPYYAGTAQSGNAPTMITLDHDGNVLIEKKNENYSKNNFNTTMNHIGGFVGNMVIYAGLTEGVGGVVEGTAGVAADPFAAAGTVNKVVQPLGRWSGLVGGTYLMSYDQNLSRAEQLIKGNDGKAEFRKGLAANLMTMGQAAAMKILPANELIREGFMKELSGKAVDFISEYGEEGLTKENLQKFMDDVVKPMATQRIQNFGSAVMKTGKQIAKANAEMLMINHANNIVESVFDDNGVVKKSDNFDQDVNTIRDVTLGTLALNGLRLIRAPFNMTLRDALYDAASNADENIARIREMANSGNVDQEHANALIKIINTAKDVMPRVQQQTTEDGNPITLGQRKKILAEEVRKAMLEESQGKAPDNAQTADALKTADANIKAQQEYNPYEKLNDHYLLKEMGVSSYDQIDPQQTYTFRVPQPPKGMKAEHIREEETPEGKNYFVTATGAEMLEYLKNPDLYETADNVRPGGSTEAAQGTLPQGEKGVGAQAEEGGGTEAPPLEDGHETVETPTSKTQPGYENTNQGPGQENAQGGSQGEAQKGDEHEGRGTDSSQSEGQQGLLNQGAAPEEQTGAAPFSEHAQETKENHEDAIRMIERKNDRITSFDLAHPGQVKEDVLRNIAAKERANEALTDAEQQIAKARRADIDEIKVEDREKRFPDRQSEAEKARLVELDKRIKLIDKYGIDDVVRRLLDTKQIERICE